MLCISYWQYQSDMQIIYQTEIAMKTDIVELIDRASKAAGSDNKLAKLIDATQPNISAWRAGTRPCPPADVALMAELAGLNADEWALRAVAAKYEGTPKGDKLKRALKALTATGAVVLSSGASAATFGAKVGAWSVEIYLRCINCLVRKRFKSTAYRLKA